MSSSNTSTYNLKQTPEEVLLARYAHTKVYPVLREALAALRVLVEMAKDVQPDKKGNGEYCYDIFQDDLSHAADLVSSWLDGTSENLVELKDALQDIPMRTGLYPDPSLDNFLEETRSLLQRNKPFICAYRKNIGLFHKAAAAAKQCIYANRFGDENDRLVTAEEGSKASDGGMTEEERGALFKTVSRRRDTIGLSYYVALVELYKKLAADLFERPDRDLDLVERLYEQADGCRVHAPKFKSQDETEIGDVLCRTGDRPILTAAVAKTENEELTALGDYFLNSEVIRQKRFLGLEFLMEWLSDATCSHYQTNSWVSTMDHSLIGFGAQSKMLKLFDDVRLNADISELKAIFESMYTASKQ